MALTSNDIDLLVDLLSQDNTLNKNSATFKSAFSFLLNKLVGDSDLSVKQDLVNAAIALVDGASIALTAIKHTLTSNQATITFSITYTGDDTTIEVTLNATSATYTFPAGSLCVSEGTASGDNTLGLSGVSGDKYMIAIKKIGSVYYVVSKNFGQ